MHKAYTRGRDLPIGQRGKQAPIWRTRPQRRAPGPARGGATLSPVASRWRKMLSGGRAAAEVLAAPK